MSTVQFTLAIHDDILPVMIRMSRTPDSSQISFEMDYLPMGVDSRDSQQTVGPLVGVHQRQYYESGAPGEFPTAVVQAALTISNYLEVKALAVEFPS